MRITVTAVSGYQTSDGKFFDNKDDAESHEASLSVLQLWSDLCEKINSTKTMDADFNKKQLLQTLYQNRDIVEKLSDLIHLLP